MFDVSAGLLPALFFGTFLDRDPLMPRTQGFLF